VLELEQLRREMPPPVAIEESEGWNAQCAGKVEVIWRRLMVMEPLDVR
jgi:DNA topoisomerase 2-associated protein PAT1